MKDEQILKLAIERVVKNGLKDEQILKRAIERAVKNGLDVHKITPFRDDAEGLWYEITQKAYPDVSVNDLIFSHEFAKFFFGEELVCPECHGLIDFESKPIDYVHKRIEPGVRKCGYTWEYVDDIKAWQYHLQMMVLKKHPLKYLEKFL